MNTHRLIAPLLAFGALANSAYAGGTINVEIDYMVTAGHSHRPTQTELNAVVQMFACQGWVLNVVVDDAIPEIPVIKTPIPGDKDQGFFSFVGPSSYKTIKDTWFDNDDGLWHYCVFGHQYDAGAGVGSSGIADAANDFVVTLWDFSDLPNGTPFEVAATFAHELGHNLGLGHGSPVTMLTGGGNHSPNYASVMSYQHQLRGVRTRLECLGIIDDTSIFKDIDYSHGRLGTLDESSLMEWVSAGIRPTDFDCDGVIDLLPLSQELTVESPWCGEVGVPSVVADHDDWAEIFDVPTGTSSALAAPPPDPDRVWRCITRAEIQAMREADTHEGVSIDPSAGCQDAVLTSEACVPSESMIWANPGAFFPGVGKGSSPYKNLSVALSNAPIGAVIYLQSGVHITDPGTLIIDQPLILSGPGGAVIDPQ